MSQRAAPSTDSRRLTVAGLVLVALVALVYVPAALRNQFAFDDTRFIVENSSVLEPAGWRGWLAFLHDPHTVDMTSPHGIVRPLRTLEFALDHALFGLSPVAFHLHSVLWHAAAGVLALLLLHRLVGRVIPATIGATVWALHPMHVEAVAWISSRGDVAMGACVFGALLLVLRSDGRDRRLACALAVGAIAMLYKETAVVLPALVFAVRLMRPVEGPPGRVAPALRAALPFVAVSAGYLAYRGLVQVGETAHATSFVLGGSTAGTFSTMFRGMGAYLVSAVLPVRTDTDWYLTPTTSLWIPSALAWLAVLVALVATAIRTRARLPLVAAAITIYLFPLIPVANWPFQLGIPTAERFLYVSLLGLALIVAGAATRRRVIPAAVAAIFALGVISHAGTPDWYDDDTLMASAMTHGTSPRGPAWFAATRRERAVDSLTAAGDVADPDEAGRQRAAAIAELEISLDLAHESIRLWQRFEGVENSISDVVLNPQINAANTALYLGRFNEALWHSDRAIAANESKFPQPHYNRAIALVNLGRHAEAVRSIERAFELGTARDDRTTIRNLFRAADALTAAGALEDARHAYRLGRDAHPELTSMGLAHVDAAERAARARPVAPSIRAARLASVGVRPPSELRVAISNVALAEFVDGCAAERSGDDASALRHFVAAQESGDLPEEFDDRATSAVQRIRSGCAARPGERPQRPPQ